MITFWWAIIGPYGLYFLLFDFVWATCMFYDSKLVTVTILCAKFWRKNSDTKYKRVQSTWSNIFSRFSSDSYNIFFTTNRSSPIGYLYNRVLYILSETRTLTSRVVSSSHVHIWSLPDRSSAHTCWTRFTCARVGPASVGNIFWD